MLLEYQIARLINFAYQNHLIDERDCIYIKNQYYDLLNIIPSENSITVTEKVAHIDEILGEIYQLIKDSHSYLGVSQEIVKAKFANILISKPSEVQAKVAIVTPKTIAYFYNYSIATNYIKPQKNKSWAFSSRYGQIVITINLSKPEKDPQQISRLKELTTNTYPKCQLCIENEGFAARQNLRLIPITLNNTTWYFQFSPYAYYPEHSIIIKQQHQDMLIDLTTFSNFFDFVDQLPNYFIGANADIPIVGGSILNHDHYQAGNYLFPLDKAENKYSIKFNAYPDITANILHWPLTTLALVGRREDLEQIIQVIIYAWYNYSDSNIIAKTGDIRHNAITPIMRKIAHNNYKLYLIFRNNIVSVEHPYGIFHAHEVMHHIKKENIGLIEAMGLAILPPRLMSELAQIKQLLLQNTPPQLDPNSIVHKHLAWLNYLFDKYTNFSANTIDDILEIEIALKFVAILECCNVFRNNDFTKFLATLNCKILAF